MQTKGRSPVSTHVNIEGAPLRCTVRAEGTAVWLFSCVQVYVFLQELLTCCAIRAVWTRKRSLACVFECVSPKLKGVGGGVGTVGTLVHLPNRHGDWPLAQGSSSITPLWVCLPLHLKRRLILLVIVKCSEEGYGCPTSIQKHSTTTQESSASILQQHKCIMIFLRQVIDCKHFLYVVTNRFPLSDNCHQCVLKD